MKTEKDESLKQLPTALGSAEIYDFLYVDRARISALYAQLFPQGLLTSVKTTAQQSFSDLQNLGSDIKVIKAESQSTEGGLEGIEHVFDASWSIPLEVLSRLQGLSLVRSSLVGTNLGGIVLTEGFLRIIDYASMRELWEPGRRLAMKQIPKSQKGLNVTASEITGLMKALPQSIHAHFLTGEGFLWSSLRPADLVIPADDLVLKHGGTISGRWKFLYILDSWADKGTPPDVSSWSGGELTSGVLNVMHVLRTIVGRPPEWFGVTPLMIFRIVNPPSISPPTQADTAGNLPSS